MSERNPIVWTAPVAYPETEYRERKSRLPSCLDSESVFCGEFNQAPRVGSIEILERKVIAP